MRTFALAFCFVILSVAAFGQAGTGTITGTVTDPAGAVIANAPVEVRNTGTNVLYPTQTTATGAYTVLRLPPGPYSISVSASGFKKLTRSGLTVDAGQTLPQDLTLEVGSNTESVTVTAEGTLLKTESSDVSHNITLGQLDELPILGIGTQNAGSNGIRNPYNAVVFLPGVSYFANFAMIVNGAPSNTAAYRVDGLDDTNHTVAFAIMQNMPNADSIQEMAVQTSNYAAEFGQAGGGLFNITLKSGTNQYHGTAFEYFVNEDLNAGIPFSFTPEGGKFRPRNRRNDYGGTFGGPFIIPKFYNGRNRTFFFYSYERYKEAQGLTFSDTLPALPYQGGNFSAISPNGGTGFNPALGVTASSVATDALGRPVYANAIYDPLTRGTTSSGTGIADPFPQNIIPSARFSPVAVAMQGLFPALSNNNLYQNYNGYNLGQRITAIPSIKVDQSIGAKQKISFSFFHTDTQAQFTTPNGNADGLPDLLTGARGSIPIGGPTYRLNYDLTVTPTLLAHAGVGYSMIYFYDSGPWTQGGKTVNCLAMLKLQGCEGSYNFPTVITGNITAPQNLGGMQQLGNALAHTATHTERPSANANMTWVHGNHTIKGGMEAWWQAQITAPPTGVGLTFGAGATSIPASLVISGGNAVGFPYASFLLGDATSTTQYAPVDARMFKSQWATFLQDSWKITRKLTMDYGLRWDYGTVPHEEHGRSADLGMNVPNPAAGGRLGAAIFEATCHCSFTSGYPYAIGPRIGFAYQINAKTVLRGGWGFAYNASPDINIQNTANIINTPTGINAFNQLNTPGAIPQPVWPNFDVGQTPLPGATSSGFLSLIDPNAGRPARQSQWSIGLQREITHNTVIEAAYVGNRGVWWPGPLGYVNQLSPQILSTYGLSPYSVPADNLLLGSTLSNSTVIGRVGKLTPYSGYATTNTLLNALRPFPQFSTIGVQASPTGKTYYDSLQMKGTKRMSHGLQINGTFTWSKAMQLIRPNLFVASDKSIQSIDQPFLFNANILYTTQSWFTNKMLRTAAKDWSIGAYLEYGSGLPLTPPAATNTNYLGGGVNGIGGSEWYRVPGQPLYTKDLNCGCINPYTDVVLNKNAWTNPANGTFGPATGTLYSDFRQARRPQENLNFGRTFHFKERYSFQIRAEFTNILNRTQIGNPSTVNPASAISSKNGQNTAGFGAYNLAVSGPNTAPTYTQNAVVGQLYQLPRSGTLIARFSF